MKAPSKIWIMTTSARRRDWLLQSIRPETAIQVVGTAATFPFLRSVIAQTSADLALIDLESHPFEGADRDWLLELLDLAPLLLLTSEPDSTVFNRMLDEGAGGILRADASSEQIVQAIASVTSGLMVLDGSLLHEFIRGSDDAAPMVEPLTPREREVFALLSDGLGNKEIASRLNISEHTIKFHMRSILGKLGASSRTEAVSRGLRSGLIHL
jgi:NarL family two-component system response regulator YdfI